jgi:vacuolar-type H+-ATPase subunit C/Vma6
MKKPSRLRYAYAVGRVRVLETKLVERAIFSEASEEDDFSSVMKVIFDAGSFSEEMVQIKGSDEMDGYLEKEARNLRRLLEEILLEEDILTIFLEESHPEKAISIAERTGYSFIKDYIRHKVDLGNIKILCRVKYSGLPREKFESLILSGGFLDEKILVENFDLSFAEIGERLRATPYHDLWVKAIDALEERETFVRLERGIEDFLMNYLKRAKYIVFGPEPIFSYALAKKRELSLVRLLGVGKINQVPPSILKERISETYV